jgi:hypothetical protein
MRAQLAQVCRLWERFFPRHDLELWEAPFDRGVFFMVAGRLTRQEALDAAASLEAVGPRPPAVLVVDSRDTPVYEAPPAGSQPERPPRAGATADAAAARAWATAQTLPVEQVVAHALAGSADDFEAAGPAGGG